MTHARRYGMDIVRRFGADRSGIALIETALLLPVAFAVLGLVVFGGEGLSIQRKTTLAARTVADLVAQTSTTATVGTTSSATLNQTTLDSYLAMAALIVYPYDSSALQAEVAEIQVTMNPTTGLPATPATGTVIWSEGYNGGAPRTVGQVISLSSSVVAAGETNLILAETQYAYNPLVISEVVGPITITGSIFMIPRSVSNISINRSS